MNCLERGGGRGIKSKRHRLSVFLIEPTLSGERESFFQEKKAAEMSLSPVNERLEKVEQV